MKFNGLTFAVVALAALCLAFYGKLDSPFLIDDRQTIEESREIESLADSWVPEKDTPLAGRRIPAVSLALDYAYAGREPKAYHRMNLILHLANGGLVFLLLVLCGTAPRSGKLWNEHANLVAFFASLLWVVHPLHVECVLYATQRTELCFAFFSLLTLLFAFRAMKSRGWLDLIVTGLAALAAANSKESAVLLLPLTVLLGRGLVSGSFAAFFREHAKLVLALVPSLIAIAMIVASEPRGLSVLMYWDDPAKGNDYLLTQGGIVWHYVQLVFLPIDQVAYYGHLVDSGTTAQTIGLSLLGLACVGGLFAIFRYPRGGLFGAWVLGLLAPTSSFAVIHTEVGADRRMYLPLIAFTLGAVLLGLWLVQKSEARKFLFGGATAVFLAFVGLTSARAADYQDLEHLWTLDLERYPHSAESDYSLGEIYRQRGEYERAIDKYRDTLAKVDAHRMARTNLGALLFERGQRDEGLQHLERAVVQDGVFPEPWNNLASAYAMLERWQDAEQVFRKGTQFVPDAPNLRIGLGKVLYVLKRVPEAREQFEQANRFREALPPEALPELDQLLQAVR